MSEITIMSYGGVNCYLVKTGKYLMLVDSGYARHRPEIEADLERAGCEPGGLRLIILTHGDSDHSGNAACFREKFRSRIAMHRAELPAVEEGDMIATRQHTSLLARAALPFYGLKPPDRFTPNLTIRDGDTFSGYHIDAEIVFLPGHTVGSIGVLTPHGELFCGDLLTNLKRPALNSLMDDKDAAAASLDKLRRLPVGTVYPGHGEPFELAELVGEKV